MDIHDPDCGCEIITTHDWGNMGYTIAHCSLHAAAPALMEAALAAIKYDDAISAHSAQTAQVIQETGNLIAGQHVESVGLDRLYEDWMSKAKAAKTKATEG